MLALQRKAVRELVAKGSRYESTAAASALRSQGQGHPTFLPVVDLVNKSQARTLTREIEREKGGKGVFAYLW